MPLPSFSQGEKMKKREKFLHFQRKEGVGKREKTKERVFKKENFPPGFLPEKGNFFSTFLLFASLTLPLLGNQIDKNVQWNHYQLSHYRPPLEDYRRGCLSSDPQQQIWGCYNWGLAIMEKNGQKALHLFQKACQLGSAEGCYSVGLLLFDGTRGVKKDWKRALPYLEKGCKLGEGLSCRLAGKIHLHRAKRSFQRAHQLEPSLPQ
ncbi:MAG: hypothetical protein C6I01_04850, partial [Epsilonproteobacteria bacterium]|nr:hypothetical protein [Campylobacterota bacterium]